jgi:hypothetical protein
MEQVAADAGVVDAQLLDGVLHAAEGGALPHKLQVIAIRHILRHIRPVHLQAHLSHDITIISTDCLWWGT